MGKYEEVISKLEATNWYQPPTMSGGWACTFRYVGADEGCREAVMELMKLVDSVLETHPDAVIPDGTEDSPTMEHSSLLEDLRWRSDDLFMEIVDCAHSGTYVTGPMRKKYDLIIKALVLIEVAEKEDADLLALLEARGHGRSATRSPQG
jgi:hypothetical protein